MSRCVRRSLAAAAVVALSILTLGSCAFPGFLGDTMTLSGPLRYTEKTGFVIAAASGTIEFGSNASPAIAATATVTNGEFTVGVGAPDSANLSAWGSLLPPGSWTISDAAAKGYALNEVVFHRTTPSVADINVLYTNFTLTTFVYFLYTDTDVSIAGSATYSAPPNDTPGSTMIMDIDLKAGWNRVVLTRTGPESGPYSDTYSLAEVPDGAYLAYGF